MNTAGIRSIGDYLKAKSDGAVSIFILLIAICSINAWQLVLPNFSYDNSYSIAAAKNIYDGKGYSITRISLQDLSHTDYEPLNKWPPGYSWLLVMIKKLTRTDWITSCYILNAIGATLLILALRKIVLLLNMPAWIVNVYLLFAGAVPYPFLSCWFSDLLAAAFFMWALAFLLQMIVKNKNSFICSIASGILLGYCTWLKYLYLPVCPIPLIILMIYAFKSDRQLLRPLFCGSLVLFVSVVFLLRFQQQHSGAAFYINPTGRGFFPESLLHFGPLIPGSMLDFGLFDFQVSTIFHIPYRNMIFIWKGLNILLLPGIIFLVLRFYQQYRIRAIRPIHIYVYLALAVSFTISVVLITLSLIQAPYTSRYTAYWTYVEELRYYAVVLLFIPQGILFLIVYRGDLLAQFRKPFLALVMVIVVIQIAHGFYYLPKQVFVKKDVGKNRISEQLDMLALNTANHLRNSGEHLIVCSNSHEIANIVSLAGLPVMYDYDSLNTGLASSKTVTLFVILNKRDLPEYKPFFSAYHPNLLFTYKEPNGGHTETDFYVVKFPGS